MKDYRKVSGFTLLEVMVALTVIALALAAVLTTVGANVRNVAGLQERTFAHWVAMNELAKIEITGKRPTSKLTSGTTEMAGQEWNWEIQLSDPENDTKEYFYIVDIVVVLGDRETPSANLKTLISKN